MTGSFALKRRGSDLAALLLGLIAVLLFALPATAQTTLDFPPLTGRVVDQANLLSPATEQALTEKLAALETGSSDQLVVVTLNSLQGQEIEDYGYQLGRAWGIGQSDNDNGALLIVAPNERKVRIEVGYGLEPILTDAFSALVIHNEILPEFREGNFEAGVVRGVDALVAQLSLDPAEAQARAAAVEEEKSGVPIVPIVIIGLVFLFMFLGAVGTMSGGRRHRRDGVTPILIWAASEALKNSGRGGGWGGGGGFGGGGFGGGGGSFGGGGASGGW